MMAPPVRLAPAFDNPDQVLDLIHKGAPYKTLAAAHKDPNEGLTRPWFRNFWALGGKPIFDGAEDLFLNQQFIDAAKQSFQAEIIRPVAMMTNLNLPGPALPQHLDLPFFRGMTNREVPSWMLAPMGYSGLFHEWAIPVASAITWFYDGKGGEFEYWPSGPDAPSETERPPYSNTCVLADNEYMYHRVGAVGLPHEFWSDASVPYEATLSLGKHWELHGKDDHLLATLPYDKVRLSVLWKAYCFKSQAMADAYDDHSDDLTADRVVELFCLDLRQRKIEFDPPTDLATDLAWKQTLLAAYTPAPVQTRNFN
ncbi:MAG: hypothetical protein AB8C46_20105 [Burkholderiaceae bacterium]